MEAAAALRLSRGEGCTAAVAPQHYRLSGQYIAGLGNDERHVGLGVRHNDSLLISTPTQEDHQVPLWGKF